MEQGRTRVNVNYEYEYHNILESHLSRRLFLNTDKLHKF